MTLTAGELDVCVGDRIRKRREYLKMSQGRLASHLGLTFSQVQKYEKGANRIGAGRLFLAAGFLKVPVEYFLEGLESFDGTSPKHSGANRPGKEESDIAMLDDAFLLISDPSQRRSILALVSALASPEQASHRSN